MKNSILLVFTIILSSIVNAQNFDTIKGKIWTCTKADQKGASNETLKHYINQKLTLKTDGSFYFIQTFPEAKMKNEVSGTYQIDNKGFLTFPTSTLTTTINGKKNSMDCYNTCMLNQTIKIISNDKFQVTFDAKLLENGEDLTLTYE